MKINAKKSTDISARFIEVVREFLNYYDFIRAEATALNDADIDVLLSDLEWLMNSNINTLGNDASKRLSRIGNYIDILDAHELAVCSGYVGKANALMEYISCGTKTLYYKTMDDLIRRAKDANADSQNSLQTLETWDKVKSALNDVIDCYNEL